MNSMKNKLDNSLLMVIAPASDNAENLDFENLISYLQSNTGFEFKIKHCKDYNEAIMMLQSGSAQIGWLGGGSANQELQAQNSLIEEFAVGVPKGKSVPFYRSQFIVRSSSDIQILEDIRNKNIALGDIFSTSGYEIPKKELSGVGIDIENENSFNSIKRVSNHDEAILEVINGNVDVAPVSSVNLELMIESKKINSKEIRIIHQSPNISGAPLVFLRNLNPTIKAKIKSLVLDAHNYVDVSGYGGNLSDIQRRGNRSHHPLHRATCWLELLCGD